MMISSIIMKSLNFFNYRGDINHGLARTIKSMGSDFETSPKKIQGYYLSYNNLDKLLVLKINMAGYYGAWVVG